MPKEVKYRIFLGYRDNSMGAEITERIFEHIKNTINYRNKYGEPYLSYKMDRSSNFIPETDEFKNIIKDVEYFIIPYSKNFFESGECDPIIIREINVALENGCKKFIAIMCKGFDETLKIESYFKEKLKAYGRTENEINYVIGAKRDFKYNGNNAEELVKEVCSYLLIKKDIRELCNKDEANVFLTTKVILETYPLYQRLYGVKRLTFLNFAGTSFIATDEISDAYEDYEMRKWFRDNLKNGNIQVDLILTEPGTYADDDASRCKMLMGEKIKKALAKDFSLNLERETDETLRHYIIRKNFNTICQFKLKNQSAKIHIYYTDVVLPYGIMESYFEKFSELNNMKIDLYAPFIKDDDRPSMILFENKCEHKDIYKIFKSSLTKFISDERYATEFMGHPDVEFLFAKKIIHRAHIKKDIMPHTKAAVLECLKRGEPIEVDLITVNNDIYVWRDEDCSKYKCIDNDKKFSCLNEIEIERVREEVTNDNEEKSQLMTLEEMLNMIKEQSDKYGIKPISLLVEIKETWAGTNIKLDKMRKKVIRACKLMENYIGDYAFHSANPQVIKIVKNYDIRIPCGQISLDFYDEKYKNLDIDDNYKQIHKNKQYFDEVIPDFLSCDIDAFDEDLMDYICEEYKIKRIGWTIDSKETLEKNKDLFDNLIVEP